MDKIKRSAEYYQLLIDKFEKSGRSPNQAKVYKEIKELVLQCSSYEEIQNRMKNEGYHEKPGVALFLDKMASLRDGAKDNEFFDVADIYQKKYDAVLADGSQIFVTGYEQDITASLGRKGNIMSSVITLFHQYLAYLNRAVYDEPLNYINDVREAAKSIEENGSDLKTALADPYNKAHILLDDASYEKFSSTMEKIYYGSIQDDFQKEDSESKFAKAWEVLKPLKKEIGEIAKKEDERSKRVVFIALPGEKLGDDYQIVERREEAK